MKRISLALLFIFTLSLSYAHTSDLFAVDAHDLDSKMKELNTLEAYLSVHPEYTYKDVQAICSMYPSSLIFTDVHSFLDISCYNNHLTTGDDDCMLYSVCICCATSILTMVYFLVVNQN